ncbi:hypothetical protein CLV51_105342 [Chitinophaga niastensis]|uniref:Uncharacterized protein n=1 Tax=Chitinophaga niastensis TaxID=536980 RepID=A0A2P8HFH7_CHINA|nr:hypothetical protein [Chitinophaga niastensis]PSL44967.1 hypothetical protein CLV51_105342 [Chitinophaga niastensis]
MQQHYQLSFFEKLIRVDLKQAPLKQKQPDKNFFSYTTSDVISQKDMMLHCFGKYLYDLGNKKQVGWYIQMHQHQLVLLMDQTAAYLSEEDIVNINIQSSETTWINLFKIIYCNLAELLSFLEREFTRYLDVDCKIPASYLLSAQNGFMQEVQILKEDFVKSGVDEHLLQIIFIPFHDFLEADHVGCFISYHQLFYLREFKKKLRLLLENHKAGTDFTERLADLLQYLNFNNIHYFRYWAEAVNNEIEELPTIREKLDRLIFLQKKTNQTAVKPDFIFSKVHPTLQNQLQSWLLNEISYQEKKESLLNSVHVADELSRWKDFKVVTVFSVSQLGNIIKLLFDSGLYLNKNKTELLDFFSYFFTTVKQDNVSSGSLRSNFYKDNAAVSKAVREILMGLVNHSRKNVNIFACCALTYFINHL